MNLKFTSLTSSLHWQRVWKKKKKKIIKTARKKRKGRRKIKLTPGHAPIQPSSLGPLGKRRQIQNENVPRTICVAKKNCIFLRCKSSRLGTFCNNIMIIFPGFQGNAEQLFSEIFSKTFLQKILPRCESDCPEGSLRELNALVFVEFPFCSRVQRLNMPYSIISTLIQCGWIITGKPKNF